MNQFQNNVVEQIKLAPKSPGVYLFFGEKQLPLYIGKAKDLRARLQSYLRPDFDDWKADLLKTAAINIETRLVKNELEALILEAKLIQSMQPELNVLLKNNRPFLYFVITKTSPPKILITRTTGLKGHYFGPFINKFKARQIYEVLVRNFGLRICSRKIKGGCLYYHLGQCAGFCKEDFDLNSYLNKITLLKNFLEKGPTKFFKEQVKRINELSKELNFEAANVLNKQLQLLQQSLPDIENAKSMTSFLAQRTDSQHLWFYHQELRMLILLQRQDMHLSIMERIFLDDFVQSQEEIDDILCRFYEQNALPIAIFCSFELSNKELLQNFLKEWHSQDSFVEIVNFDQNSSDLPIYFKLAREIFMAEVERNIKIPFELQELLGAPAPIKTIDCFDISHHQELVIVGACTRFMGVLPQKKFFRHFYVNSTKTPNDFLAMQEVVQRRYLDADPDTLPDLILIDGGKGQLSAVKKVLPNFLFASLAKRKETLIWGKDKNVFEQELDQASSLGRFLIHIRNTTHNFAVSFHRKIKNKI